MSQVTPHRGVPFVQAAEVLKTATTVIPDRMVGFYRYANGSMEMVYNPTTKEVRYLQPLSCECAKSPCRLSIFICASGR